MLKRVSQLLNVTKSFCGEIRLQVVAIASAWMISTGFQSVGTKARKSTKIGVRHFSRHLSWGPTDSL